MGGRRVLAIGLDGFEPTYADELIATGVLPELASLRRRDAHLLLEHGAAARTGLSWEHFWSGLDPDAAQRWSSVEFDSSSYAAWAEGAQFTPFFGREDIDAVVLDAPYADFDRAPQVRGIVAWGAHDPGIGTCVANPPRLLDELTARVGPYPAADWLYGCPWPSIARTDEMGRALEAGIDAHGAAAKWLFTERLPDWDLAVVVLSELHAAAEGLWHGIDPSHPLHDHPSAETAAAALRRLYRATDRLVGELTRATDALCVVFTMGGMGTNGSDVPTMVLLPELLFRWSVGKRLLELPAEWTTSPTAAPRLETETASWPRSWYPTVSGADRPGTMRALAERLPAPIRNRVRAARSAARARERPVGYQSLEWIPGTWYRPWWPQMTAFALPSFYDGRIRANLRGREGSGVVDISDYGRVCDELEALVRSCVDPRTGESVVETIERPGADTDPMTLPSTTADLVIEWRGTALCFSHPDLGLVGPVPYRRTGGHTGPHGFASFSGPDVVAGDYGIASAFDVAPTILELVTNGSPTGVCGSSLAPRLLSAEGARA